MNTLPRMSLGALLRRYRERAGLSQEALAERAGLTPHAISALERGERRRPYPHTVQALAEALHLAAEERAALLAARAPQHGTPPPEPAVPRPSTPPSLPSSLTPIIGRDMEVAALLHLLGHGGVRLVTLTGPGGVGKTRLALDFVQRVAGQFRDGVVWVPLAATTDPALVLPTIAAACGVRDAGAHQVLNLLQHVLHPQHRLLVLDNVEHLRPAAPDLVALLGACPQLTVFTTSRAPLHVRGEQEFPVAPLPLPALDDIPHVEEVVQSPAVQLFVARAQAAYPNFALTPANAATVAAICRRLDGLPLALELAAARVKVLGTTGLLARLERVLLLLTGGAHDLPERQHTMRTTIAWSYDLLDAPTQALFRRLAVFRGGWTLETAEAVDVLGEEHLVDALGHLVDQSLVSAGVDVKGEDVRYRMLEPIRQYAVERLEASGEEKPIRNQHAATFVALGERAGPALFGADQARWLDRLDKEHDNLRAALAWLLEQDVVEDVARLVWALHQFWWLRGHLAEGQRWLAQVLARREALEDATCALALLAAGKVAYAQGNHAVADTLLDQSIAMASALGDRTTLAHTLAMQGYTALGMHDLGRAAATLEPALALHRQLGNRWGEGFTLNALGYAALFAGDPTRGPCTC